MDGSAMWSSEIGEIVFFWKVIVFSDFVEYLDPTYGACFTYGQKLGNITNERSGPAYGRTTMSSEYEKSFLGLRLEVFVNVTEYLPTTEAAGVRLTVHATDEQPFPDTLGFSAPTGFVSSFGIKLVSTYCWKFLWFACDSEVNGETAGPLRRLCSRGKNGGLHLHTEGVQHGRMSEKLHSEASVEHVWLWRPTFSAISGVEKLSGRWSL